MHKFQVVREEFEVKLMNNLTNEFVSVIPSLGGAVNRCLFNTGDELTEIIDGYGSAEDASANLSSSFKGSNLSPFPNRIADGKYIFEKEEIQLTMNFPDEKNAIHGLVFDKKFSVLESEDGVSDCKLVLSYENDDPIGYPFRYLMKITYKLNLTGAFSCRTEITNIGATAMPYGHGWHPYFKLGNRKIDELKLQFSADRNFKVDKRNIPTGETVPYNEFNNLTLVGNIRLDDCFLLETEKPFAETIITDGSGATGYRIWQETGERKYNYLQVYTPPHRTTIAIEPMTCAPDAFNNKVGLMVLNPGEKISFDWGIKKL